MVSLQKYVIAVAQSNLAILHSKCVHAADGKQGTLMKGIVHNADKAAARGRYILKLPFSNSTFSPGCLPPRLAFCQSCRQRLLQQTGRALCLYA